MREIEKIQTEIEPTKSESLGAIIRAEMDAQLDRANMNPRNIEKVLEDAYFMATQDKDIASACFYCLPKDGKILSGISVRFAEIIANCWGNIRAGARIISNDGKRVVAQAICIDLEKNTGMSIEVERSIIDKNGKKYREDLIVSTSNAACSIALRNSIFKVVPTVLTLKLQERIKEFSLGTEDFEQAKQSVIEEIISNGVTAKQILTVLGKENLDDITPDHVFSLKGIINAIKDGDTTFREAFSMSKSSGHDKMANTFSESPDAEF